MSPEREDEGVSYTTVSSRLHWIRERARMSPRLLARFLTHNGRPTAGLSVVRMEGADDDSQIPTDYTATVARLFGVRPEWLLYGDGDPGGWPFDKAG